jgi:hypothetical protein
VTEVYEEMNCCGAKKREMKWCGAKQIASFTNILSNKLRLTVF